MWKLIGTYFIAIMFVGCSKNEHQREGMFSACAPLQSVDGFFYIKTEEGLSLKLPSYADVRRRKSDPGCEYVRDFFYKLPLVRWGVDP